MSSISIFAFLFAENFSKFNHIGSQTKTLQETRQLVAEDFAEKVKTFALQSKTHRSSTTVTVPEIIIRDSLLAFFT